MQDRLVWSRLPGSKQTIHSDQEILWHTIQRECMINGLLTPAPIVNNPMWALSCGLGYRVLLNINMKSQWIIRTVSWQRTTIRLTSAISLFVKIHIWADWTWSSEISFEMEIESHEISGTSWVNSLLTHFVIYLCALPVHELISGVL